MQLFEVYVCPSLDQLADQDIIEREVVRAVDLIKKAGITCKRADSMEYFIFFVDGSKAQEAEALMKANNIEFEWVDEWKQ